LTLNQVLRNHAFTEGLSEPHIATLAAVAAEVDFADGEVVLDTGGRSRYFYLLLSGSVTVELHAPSFTVSVQALGPGQAFGWSALLDQQDTLFRVRAREPTTALRFAASDLADAFRADTSLAAAILLRTLKLAATRVEATEARFAEMCGIKIECASLPVYQNPKMSRTKRSTLNQ